MKIFFRLFKAREFSQEEIGFKMKCGLNLRERLVK
jgi:hypothetical protein